VSRHEDLASRLSRSLSSYERCGSGDGRQKYRDGQSCYEAQGPALQHPVADTSPDISPTADNTNSSLCGRSQGHGNGARPATKLPWPGYAEGLVVITILPPERTRHPTKNPPFWLNSFARSEKVAVPCRGPRPKVGVFASGTIPLGWPHLAVHDVVGQVEKAPDESLVGRLGPCPRPPYRSWRTKATLAPVGR